MKLKEIIDTLNGNTRRRSRVRTVVSTALGIFAGALTGIMLAPKSGRKIRKDIKNRAEFSAEKVRSTAQKTENFVKKEAALVNDTVSKKMNGLKSHLKRAKKASKVKLKEIEKDNKS